jgi:hypothetical protein
MGHAKHGVAFRRLPASRLILPAARKFLSPPKRKRVRRISVEFAMEDFWEQSVIVLT